jgi:hypothetical protein
MIAVDLFCLLFAFEYYANTANITSDTLCDPRLKIESCPCLTKLRVQFSISVLCTHLDETQMMVIDDAR